MIEATSGMLDVSKGAHKIEKRLKGRPLTGSCPEEFRIPVTITGYIDYAYNDRESDGSQSFVVTVEKVEVKL
jgi:hypothetical protein